jgi:branched-chain amino acid transport system permease protein
MRRALPLLLLLALAAAAAPLVIAESYYTNIASQILIAAVFALSLNLLVGYAGLTSLGHAAYLGIAAYMVAFLTVQLGWGQLAAAAASLAVTVALAMLFGAVALRASGLGFLMITLAEGQVMWGIAYRWVEVTNGDNGIPGVRRPLPFGIDLTAPKPFYLFCLAVFLIALLQIRAMVRSGFGAAIVGTRDQPRRMRMLGFDVRLVRWLTFVAAGFWAGVAGILFVYYNQYISPHVLGLTNSVEVLLMVIAGGAGTLGGPILGAAIVVVLKNVASAYVSRWVMLLGIVFVLIVVFMPEGLVPGITSMLARRRARATRSVALDTKRA